MGVHTLLYWKAGEGAGEQHAFDALLNALASLQGVQEQRWSAQAAALRQTVQQEPDAMPSATARAGRDLLQRVTFSDLPGRIFLLTRGDPSHVIEADTGTQGLLDRYALSKLRAALQLEGWQYSLGDFVVRAARVVQAPQQQFLGLVLDVVYQPLSHTGPAEAAILQDFSEIMQDAVTAAGGTLRRQQQTDRLPRQGATAPAVFLPRHRAMQYAQLMRDLAT